jgi:hypothetical protein
VEETKVHVLNRVRSWRELQSSIGWISDRLRYKIADLSAPGPRELTCERLTVVFPRSDRSGDDVPMAVERLADNVSMLNLGPDLLFEVHASAPLQVYLPTNCAMVKMFSC